MQCSIVQCCVALIVLGVGIDLLLETAQTNPFRISRMHAPSTADPYKDDWVSPRMPSMAPQSPLCAAAINSARRDMRDDREEKKSQPTNHWREFDVHCVCAHACRAVLWSIQACMDETDTAHLQLRCLFWPVSAAERSAGLCGAGGLCPRHRLCRFASALHFTAWRHSHKHTHTHADTEGARVRV